MSILKEYTEQDIDNLFRGLENAENKIGKERDIAKLLIKDFTRLTSRIEGITSDYPIFVIGEIEYYLCTGGKGILKTGEDIAIPSIRPDLTIENLSEEHLVEFINNFEKRFLEIIETVRHRKEAATLALENISNLEKLLEGE